MTERVTNEMLTSSTLRDLGGTLSAMERSSEELSSGRSILQPSDDPYGASRAIALQSALDGLSSYAGSVRDATAWQETVSSSLSSIDEVVSRVRELTLEGANGVNDRPDREAIADEVEQLTEAIKQDANAQYAGQYVFSGTSTATAPYRAGANDDYEGGTGTVARAIGPGATVSISTDIASLLGNGQGAADGKLLDVLRTIAEDLRGGGEAEAQALGGADLQGLEANAATLTSLQADVGAGTDQLQMAASRIEGLQGTTTAALSGVQDANVVAVSTDYANQQAAYQAALKADADILQMPSLIEFLG